MSTLLEAALDYARQGRAVFPLIAYRKEPATRRGFHDATTNPATIRRWWTARADYNIGIRTGAASGIWIFDIDIDDDKDGEASLRDLEVEHGKLPATMQSITAHGRHAWFAYTCPIPSTCSRIGPGLDVAAMAAISSLRRASIRVADVTHGRLIPPRRQRPHRHG